MSGVSTVRWDVDEPEQAGLGEGSPPLRAKLLVRRTSTKWLETEDVWRATIGRWAVTVAESPGSSIDPEGAQRPATWEWSAFGRIQGKLPRALRCRGFSRRELAQLDAESTLSRLG